VNWSRTPPWVGLVPCVLQPEMGPAIATIQRLDRCFMFMDMLPPCAVMVPQHACGLVCSLLDALNAAMEWMRAGDGFHGAAFERAVTNHRARSQIQAAFITRSHCHLDLENQHATFQFSPPVKVPDRSRLPVKHFGHRTMPRIMPARYLTTLYTFLICVFGYVFEHARTRV